jgi:hypothetical protein
MVCLLRRRPQVRPISGSEYIIDGPAWLTDLVPAAGVQGHQPPQGGAPGFRPPGAPGGGAPGITFDRFVRACVVIKQLTDAFQKLDTDRDGWVQINYDQFMHTVLQLP